MTKPDVTGTPQREQFLSVAFRAAQIFYTASGKPFCSPFGGPFGGPPATKRVDHSHRACAHPAKGCLAILLLRQAVT